MPRRDGTGPLGMGAKTGRRLGLCSESNTAEDLRTNLRGGQGCNCGFRRYNQINNNNVESVNNPQTVYNNPEAIQNASDNKILISEENAINNIKLKEEKTFSEKESLIEQKANLISEIETIDKKLEN